MRSKSEIMQCLAKLTVANTRAKRNNKSKHLLYYAGAIKSLKWVLRI